MFIILQNNIGDIMNKVPKIIGTKDLSYISDMLNWTFTFCKKTNNYLSCIENDDVYNTISEASNCLKNVYNSLLDIIKEDK